MSFIYLMCGIKLIFLSKKRPRNLTCSSTGSCCSYSLRSGSGCKPFFLQKCTHKVFVGENLKPFSSAQVTNLSRQLCRRGTGMIASSSTFRPHPGRVIRDLFRLLDAVTALYGSTSLQQSSKGSCSLLVSGYNLWADCQWRTLVPPLNSGANAAPASVLALMKAVVALNNRQ